MPLAPPSPVEETVDAAVTQEVSEFLTSAQSTLLNSALDEAEQRRREQYEGDDELLGLDEEELDRFLLTEEEVRIKERVWVEMNKDYLEAIAGERILACRSSISRHCAVAERYDAVKAEHRARKPDETRYGSSEGLVAWLYSTVPNDEYE